MLEAHITKLPQSDKKKFRVTIFNPYYGTKKSIKFGANGYEDFTTHKDITRLYYKYTY